MNIESKELKEQFGKNLIINENLSKYNWFNLGGPADIFFRPDNKDQLIDFLKKIKKLNLNINFIGAGSNTLIRDSGIKGAVIKLGSKFSQIKLVKENIIEVGAATLDKRVSDFAKENCIGGMEFLSCIPGSVGGAIIMNSGCYGSEISQILLSIRILDKNGEEKEIKREEINFFYRGSNISEDYLVLSAKLKGELSSQDSIKKKQKEFIERKKISQPSRIKTGGSTFKNHKEKKAWELIKESGCEKFSIGDAKISEKHCNFFINDGNAKTSDVEKLINKVKKEVYKKTGVNLELEIKIIGDEK
ncbi:UDP-N-acetylmuramate dehydrogenase [Candidatus Pelagibacter bacterium]|nr:UDP-N-acetylmuramate dehydrogenase [Candidatus Pelagibacter bacterium]